MVEAFRAAQRPLWVAYYRRALPRFLKVRELLRARAIGRADVDSSQASPTRSPTATPRKRGASTPTSRARDCFSISASHYFDIIDFLAGPITAAAGFALNTGGSYAAEDVTAAAFQIGDKVVGTGVWNFNAPVSADSIVFTGSEGEIATAVLADEDVVVTRGGQPEPLSLPQPSARTPAADSDDRRRAARARDSASRPARRGAVVVGDGSVPGGVLRVTKKENVRIAGK